VTLRTASPGTSSAATISRLASSKLFPFHRNGTITRDANLLKRQWDILESQLWPQQIGEGSMVSCHDRQPALQRHLQNALLQIRGGRTGRRRDGGRRSVLDEDAPARRRRVGLPHPKNPASAACQSASSRKPRDIGFMYGRGTYAAGLLKVACGRAIVGRRRPDYTTSLVSRRRNRMVAQIVGGKKKSPGPSMTILTSAAVRRSRDTPSNRTPTLPPDRRAGLARELCPRANS